MLYHFEPFNEFLEEGNLWNTFQVGVYLWKPFCCLPHGEEETEKSVFVAIGVSFLCNTVKEILKMRPIYVIFPPPSTSNSLEVYKNFFLYYFKKFTRMGLIVNFF